MYQVHRKKKLVGLTKCLVVLSSKTYVFQDKMTRYSSVWLVVSFSVFIQALFHFDIINDTVL